MISPNSPIWQAPREVKDYLQLPFVKAANKRRAWGARVGASKNQLVQELINAGALEASYGDDSQDTLYLRWQDFEGKPLPAAILLVGKEELDV